MGTVIVMCISYFSLYFAVNMFACVCVKYIYFLPFLIPPLDNIRYIHFISFKNCFKYWLFYIIVFKLQDFKKNSSLSDFFSSVEGLIFQLYAVQLYLVGRNYDLGIFFIWRLIII